MTDSRHRDRLTRSELIVVALAIVTMAALALQPLAVSRTPDRQSEFVWEMFSKSAPREEFVLDLGDREVVVTPADVVAPARANVVYTSFLPEWLCERDSDVLSVTVLRNGAVLRVVECPA